MWAALASMILHLDGLPPFEILVFVFFISFFSCFGFNKFTKKQTERVNYPFYVWFCGIFGIFGNGAAFIIALDNAPAAHADLINYLWPLFLILLIPTLKTESFSPKHLISGLIAFIGVVMLITNGTFQFHVSAEYYYGYMWALISALCWTSYTFSCRVYGKPSPEIIYIFCGCSFILALATHLVLESFIMPTFSQFLIMLLMGLTSHSSAFYLWDYGVKKGNFRLLCILSYGNPITSVFFLVLFGFSEPSVLLAISTLMVSGASIIYVIKWRKILNSISPIPQLQSEYKESALSRD